MKNRRNVSPTAFETRILTSYFFAALLVGNLSVTIQAEEDYQALLETAKKASRSGKWEEGLKGLNVVVEILSNEPQSPLRDFDLGVALAYRGAAKNGLDDLKGAEEDYTAVLELESDPERRAPVLFNRSQNRSELKDFEGVVEDLTAYLTLVRNPEKRATALNERAVALQQLGKNENAIEDYTLAIELNKDLAPAYSRRGMLLWRKGEYAKSVADYTETIRLLPKDAEAYNFRALILATCPDPKVRDGEQALADADKATKLSDNPLYFNTLAAAYAEAGKFDAAVAIMEKLIKGSPDSFKNAASPYLKLFKEKKPLRIDPTGKAPKK